MVKNCNIVVNQVLLFRKMTGHLCCFDKFLLAMLLWMLLKLPDSALWIYQNRNRSYFDRLHTCSATGMEQSRSIWTLSHWIKWWCISTICAPFIAIKELLRMMCRFGVREEPGWWHKAFDLKVTVQVLTLWSKSSIQFNDKYKQYNISKANNIHHELVTF